MPRQLATSFATTVLLCGLFGSVTLGSASADQSKSCGANSETIIGNAYPDAVKIVGKGFKVGDTTIALDDDGDTYDSAQAPICRVWPANPNLTLVAVPLIKTESEDGNTGDLDLLVMDAQRMEVKSRLRLEDRMNDDAIRINTVDFDTARYRLAKDQTAFGLRISAGSNSRASPYDETNLWLYVIDKDTLRPVLDGMVVSRSTGEWDTNCAGEFNESQVTLSVAPNAGTGYADLVAVETGSVQTNTLDKKGECNDASVKTKPQTLRLVYDGTQYPIPEAQRTGAMVE